MSFDFYKEVILNYRKILPRLDIQEIRDHALAAPQSNRTIETLQLEVFKRNRRYILFKQNAHAPFDNLRRIDYNVNVISGFRVGKQMENGMEPTLKVTIRMVACKRLDREKRR